MELRIDKAALLEYIDDIEGIGVHLRLAKDKCFGQYHSCKQRYTRLYTEREEAARRAYHKVEAAESMQRAADAEYELALKMRENAEDDSARAKAETRLRQAQSMRLEAEDELSRAAVEYSNAQGALKFLDDLWEKYRLRLEAAAGRVEDGLSSFLTVVSNGNRDLGEYLDAIDKFYSVLYDGETPAPPQSASGSLQSTSSAGNPGPSKSETAAFRTSAGNTLMLAETAGAASIVMTLSGKTHIFPGTKSGSARAYRAALKSGDSEMIQRTKELFSDASGSTPSQLPANQQYVVDTLSGLQKGLPETIDREMVLAGAEVRKMRRPDSSAASGELKGVWKDSVFYLDDDFVPTYMNDEGLSVGEIKQLLRQTCGLTLDGIPFVDGVADFSSLSVASIPTKDIVMQAKKMSSEDYDGLEPLERTSVFSEVFDKGRRSANFSIADQLAAERQLPIPGLSPGYTAAELADWRSDPKHRFTWDEQVHGGYNLVPTVIHGNISHTGLVSSSTKAKEYFERRKEDPPEKYSWSEEDAPISVAEVLKGKNKKDSGDSSCGF